MKIRFDPAGKQGSTILKIQEGEGERGKQNYCKQITWVYNK